MLRRTEPLLAAVAGTVAIGLLGTSPALAAMKTTKVTVIAGKPTIFAFTLSKKTVPVGAVVFTVTNKGTIEHSFKICSKGGTANTCSGKATKILQPKQTAKLTYDFKKKGTYEYLCTVPGHAAAGMKGDLKVT